MAEAPTDRPTVAIAGATGFIGTALRRALADDYDIIGLTRSPVRADANNRSGSALTWRQCDLFDPYSVRDGLAGARYAIYLVHSMVPSARLTQGRVADLDVLQADNFARAAADAGVEQLLYLGALVPEDHRGLPPPLQHRLDIQRTLASTSVPLTTVRAGLVVGPGGTWLRLLLNLVRRLPVMILPSWTRSETQPVARRDVVRGLRQCLGAPETYGETYDIGGPDVMNYREMLRRTATVLGRRRRMATVPIESPRLSKLWVRVFGGVPWALVSPIIDSLRYQTRIQPNPLQEALLPEAQSFEEAVAAAVDDRGRPLPNPRDELRPREDTLLREESAARSVHRMPCPSGFTVRDVADEYLRWLSGIGGPLIRVRVEFERVAHVVLRPGNLTLLSFRFTPDRSPVGRELFVVTGGALVGSGERSPRLEFREVLNREAVIAAVHDFSPRLPWPVYSATQALVHALVMRGFGRHMERVAAEAQVPSTGAAGHADPPDP